MDERRQIATKYLKMTKNNVKTEKIVDENYG